MGGQRPRCPTEAGTGITDRYAFEQCFEELFPVVHRYIARRIGTALADDLAAETFATAYRRRNDYDPARGSGYRAMARPTTAPAPAPAVPVGALPLAAHGRRP